MQAVGDLLDCLAWGCSQLWLSSWAGEARAWQGATAAWRTEPHPGRGGAGLDRCGHCLGLKMLLGCCCRDECRRHLSSLTNLSLRPACTCTWVQGARHQKSANPPQDAGPLSALVLEKSYKPKEPHLMQPVSLCLQCCSCLCSMQPLLLCHQQLLTLQQACTAMVQVQCTGIFVLNAGGGTHGVQLQQALSTQGCSGWQNCCSHSCLRWL